MIYILGERPGPNTDPSRPLYPHTNIGAAARLRRLLNLKTDEEYLAVTSRLNAVDDKSSTASVEARSRVASFLVKAGQSPFIVLGKSALRAMPAQFRKMQFGDIIDNVLLLPHTSGVNRVWNDPDFSQRMKEIARSHVSSSGTNKGED